MESRRGEKSGQRLYSARPEQGFSIEGPRPCALSLELPGAERSGEAYRRSLSHDCTIASSPVSRDWSLVYLERLARCPGAEDRQGTADLAALETPEEVASLPAPLHFWAEETERNARWKPQYVD